MKADYGDYGDEYGDENGYGNEDDYGQEGGFGHNE